MVLQQPGSLSLRPFSLPKKPPPPSEYQKPVNERIGSLPSTDDVPSNIPIESPAATSRILVNPADKVDMTVHATKALPITHNHPLIPISNNMDIPEPGKTTDPRLRRPSTSLQPQQPLQSHEQTSLVKSILELLTSDYAFQKARDKQCALERELKARTNEAAHAKNNPYPVFTNHFNEGTEKLKRQLTSARNDCTMAKQKQGLHLNEVIKSCTSMLPSSEQKESEDETRRQLSNLRQELRTLTRESKDKLDTQDRKIAEMKEHLQLYQQQDNMAALRTDLDEIKELVEIQDTRFAGMEKSRLESLTTRTEELTSIQELSHQFSQFAKKEHLTSADLSGYINDFEKFRKDTDTRFLKVEADQGALNTSCHHDDDHSLLESALKDISTLQDQLRRFQESISKSSQQMNATDAKFNSFEKRLSNVSQTRGHAELTQADRKSLQEMALVIKRVNELFTAVQQVSMSVNRNNHTIVQLNHRYNNLTSEPLLKEMMRVFSPFLSTIQGAMIELSTAVRDIKNDQTASKTAHENLAKTFSDLQNQSAANHDQISRLNEQVELFDQSTKAIENKIKEVEVDTTLADFKTDVTKLQEVLPTIQNQLGRLEDDCQKLPDDIKASQDAMTFDLNKLIAEFKNGKAEVDARMDRLDVQISQYGEQSTQRTAMQQIIIDKDQNTRTINDQGSKSSSLASRKSANKLKAKLAAHRQMTRQQLPAPTENDFRSDSDESSEDAFEIRPKPLSTAIEQRKTTTSSESTPSTQVDIVETRPKPSLIGTGQSKIPRSPESTPDESTIEMVIDLTTADDDQNIAIVDNEDYLKHWTGPVPGKDNQHSAKQDSTSASLPNSSTQKSKKRKRTIEDRKSHGTNKLSKA